MAQPEGDHLESRVKRVSLPPIKNDCDAILRELSMMNTRGLEQTPKSTNIYWQEGVVSRAEREAAQGHAGVTLWLTGLSGSGKTTLACALEAELFSRGCKVFVLDGDNVRHGLNRDLGFSPADRRENIRRIGEVAKLLTGFGAIVITAFISPYAEDRESVRAMMHAGDFAEIFVACDLAVCEARDPKGLYEKARRGEIREFTGISAPYESPSAPELVVRTDHDSEKVCVDQILAFLEQNGYTRPTGVCAPAAD